MGWCLSSLIVLLSLKKFNFSTVFINVHIFHRVLKSSGILLLLVGTEVKHCIYKLLSNSDANIGKDRLEADEILGESSEKIACFHNEEKATQINTSSSSSARLTIKHTNMEDTGQESGVGEPLMVLSKPSAFQENASGQQESSTSTGTLNKDGMNKVIPPVEKHKESNCISDCSWTVCEEHYVKLGDTDAFICVMRKA